MNTRFIIILIGCVSLLAVVSMANTNISADVDEYRVVSTNVLHIEKLITERMHVIEDSVSSYRFRGSQQSILSYIKMEISNMIPCFVDYAQFTNSSEGWFETPSGMDTNGHVLYPDSFPMYDVQEVLTSVGAPSNYLEYTPWRPLTANAVGYTNAEMQAGTDSTDYGWKHVVPILQKLRYTEKAPDGISAQTMRIHSYAYYPCLEYEYGYRTCTESPEDWCGHCDNGWYSVFPLLPKQGEMAVSEGSVLRLEDQYMNEYSEYSIEQHSPDMRTVQEIIDRTQEFRVVISNLCVVVSNASSVDASASFYLIGVGEYIDLACHTECQAVLSEDCSGSGDSDYTWYYDYPTLGSERRFVYSVGTVSANSHSTLTVGSIEPPVAADIPEIELYSISEDSISCDRSGTIHTRYESKEETVRQRVFRLFRKFSG